MMVLNTTILINYTSKLKIYGKHWLYQQNLAYMESDSDDTPEMFIFQNLALPHLDI